MAKRTISIKIPVRQPDKLLKLGEEITVKHKSFPSGTSPLKTFDMTGFEAKVTDAKTKRVNSRKQKGTSESLFVDANRVIGIVDNKTHFIEGTIYYYLTQVRDQLLVTHSDNEEMLSRYGFHVVIGSTRGRQTVRVEIPIREPDKLMALCDAIFVEHNALGANSPLSTVNMADFAVKLGTVKSKRTDAQWYRRDSEELMLESDFVLGISEGQNSETEGTVYNMIGRIRDQLLVVYRNDEEKLGKFGFDVVIGSYMPVGRKPQVPKITVKINGSSVNFGARLLGILMILWGDGTSVRFTGDPNATNFIDKVYAVAKLYTILITEKISEIVELHINNSNLTYIKLHKSMKKLELFIAQNNMFTTEVVDDILITINKYGTSGPGRVINLLGSEPPSAKGLAAKAELEARGWMVLVAS